MVSQIKLYVVLCPSINNMGLPPFDFLQVFSVFFCSFSRCLRARLVVSCSCLTIILLGILLVFWICGFMCDINLRKLLLFQIFCPFLSVLPCYSYYAYVAPFIIATKILGYFVLFLSVFFFFTFHCLVFLVMCNLKFRDSLLSHVCTTNNPIKDILYFCYIAFACYHFLNFAFLRIPFSLFTLPICSFKLST
jgi:hypothetical protein